MQILIVNDWKEYAGAEKIIQYRIEELNKLGHEVKLLVYPNFHTFKKTVLNFKPDIVNFHNIILTGILPVLYCKSEKIPIIQSLHDYWLVCKFRHHYILRENKICPYHDWNHCMNCQSILLDFPEPPKLFKIYQDVPIEVPSQYFKSVLVKFGYKEENIFVVQHGIPEVKLPIKDENYIFDVTSYVPWKGKEFILELAKKHSKLRFVTAGVTQGRIINTDPAYREEIELHQLYSNCSLLINPTRWEEPCGLVNLEAMMHHKVVLGLKVGSLPEYVKNCLFNSYEEIENAVLDLMNDPEKRMRLGEENYKHYIENFTSEKMVKRYLEVIEGLVKK